MGGIQIPKKSRCPGPVSLSRKRAMEPVELQPTRRRVTPGLPSGASKADAVGIPGSQSLESQGVPMESRNRPPNPNLSTPNQINQINQIKNDSNTSLQPVPLAPAPQSAPKESQRLEIWKVLGDCRCLFRAVVRSRYLDQCNEIPRSSKGEPLEEQSRIKECQIAEPWLGIWCDNWIVLIQWDPDEIHWNPIYIYIFGIYMAPYGFIYIYILFIYIYIWIFFPSIYGMVHCSSTLMSLIQRLGASNLFC